jgi:hypothetical protein
MKKILYLAVLFVVASVSFISCDDEETYAEQKEREARHISNWISQHNIEIISVSDFLKDTITNNPETGPDKTRNQYVLFPDNGVYMQIVKRGGGSAIEPGETKNMNARFVERYVSSGDTISMNLFQSEPDVFYVKRTGDNYSASFIAGTGGTSSIMARLYGYSVPNAWLMPFPYIKPGMLDGAAKVRLIVPHNQGTQTAAANVYPTFYEITISSQKWQ